MSVEQFDPNDKQSTSNSAQNQTTTLATSAKILSALEKEQAQAASNAQIESVNVTGQESVRAAKIGFISLGCPTA